MRTLFVIFKKPSLLVAIISLFAAAVFPAAVAHAAGTVTWTGGGVNGNWSTTGNWVGGVIPANGDDVVIDNSANFSNGSINDIAGLDINSLTFTNDGSSSPVDINLAQSLTVDSAITQAASDTTTGDNIQNNGSAVTITLGGNVIVTSSAGLVIGALTPADTLALAGNTLTFTDNGVSGGITTVNANITGSGSVVYNGAATDYQLSGANTYTGTTHVIATSLPIENTNNNNAFGSSSITVETGGSVDFSFSSNTTISNPIAVTGTTSGSPVTSLGFSTLGSGVTLSVPAITLNGDTRFANNASSSSQLVVDLAGIVANGHCIQYIGFGGSATDGPSNGFVNGPAGCVVSGGAGAGTPAPSTPDTGLAAIMAHPAVALIGSLSAACTLVVMAHRLKPAKR